MVFVCMIAIALWVNLPISEAQVCQGPSLGSKCVASPPTVGGPPPQSLTPVTTNGILEWWYTLPYLITRALPADVVPQDLITNLTTTFVRHQIPEDAVINEYTQTYVMWAVPLLAVSCIGLFFGCVFLVAGMSFCFCLCFIAHRKRKTTSSFGTKHIEPKKDRKKCAAWFTVSVLIILFMLFGFIMACLCVWQYSAATVAFPSSIDASSSILTNYLNDTSHEYLNQAIRGIDVASDCITSQLSGVPTTVSSAVISRFNLPEDVQQVSERFNSLVQTLNDVLTTSVGLSTTAGSLATSLNATSGLTGIFFSRREHSTGMLLQEALGNISALVPDLELDLASDVQIYLDDLGTNVEPIISKVQEALNDASVSITNSVNNSVTSVDAATLKGQTNNMLLDELKEEAVMVVNNLLTWHKNLFLLDPSTQQDRNSYSSLRALYDYGWSIAIIFCVFGGLTLVAMTLILVMAIFGYKSLPQLRTTLAEFTRLSLRIFSAYLFMFGFLFAVFTAIYFCIGANFGKTCEGLSGPDYTALDETLSNPQWRQNNLVDKFAVLENKDLMSRVFSSNITLGSLFSQCYGGATVWQVLELDRLWAGTPVITTLEDITTNFDTLVSSYRASTTGAALSGSSAAVQSLSREIVNLETTYVLLPLDFSNFMSSVSQLGTSRDMLVTVQTSLDTTNQELSRLSDSITMLLNMISLLEMGLDELKVLNNSYTQLVALFQDELTTLRTNAIAFSSDIRSGASISSPVALGAVQCELSSVANGTSIAEQLVYYNTSFCYPIWKAYNKVYAAACGDLLGPINGFWFAMGWFMLGVIPSIVTLLGLSQHYKKLNIPRRRATSAVKALVYRQSLSNFSAQRKNVGEMEMYRNPAYQTVQIRDDDGGYQRVVAHSTVAEAEFTESETNLHSVPTDSQTNEMTVNEVHENTAAVRRDPPPAYENLESEG